MSLTEGEVWNRHSELREFIGNNVFSSAEKEASFFCILQHLHNSPVWNEKQEMFVRQLLADNFGFMLSLVFSDHPTFKRLADGRTFRKPPNMKQTRELADSMVLYGTFEGMKKWEEKYPEFSGMAVMKTEEEMKHTLLP